MTKNLERSASLTYIPNGRYLPDGSLNIAGRWKSPGPGKYFLPSCTGFQNHDFTLEKRPAYSIGLKWKDLTKDSNSPGPIYYPPSDVTVHGRVKTATGYITSRPKNDYKQDGPGPMQYSPEKYIPHPSPAFTIGTKHKHLEQPVHTVGPNQYVLPNTIGYKNFQTNIRTAPKFTLSTRNKFMSITYGMDDSPSKLYYPSLNHVKHNPPRWTMSGRNYLPEMDKTTPGPNAYKSENVKINYRSPPRVTLGIRHSEFCSTGFPLTTDE